MLLFYSFVCLRIDSKGILFSWCYSLREDLNTLYRQLWQVSYGLLAEWCIPSITTPVVYYRKLTRLYRFTIHLIEYFAFDLDPKRSLGVLGNLAFLTLTGSSVALAVRLLKWV